MKSWKQWKRENRLLAVIIAALLVIIAVAAILNTGDLRLKHQLEEDQQFIISWGEDEQVLVTMDDLLSLEPKDYDAILDTSISDAKEVRVYGVELTALMDFYGVPWRDAEYFSINGLDEYYSPVLIDEVLEPDNVLICVGMDGKALGNKSSGGFGPYLMVIRNEFFSQRWCKYIEEVTVH